MYTNKSLGLLFVLCYIHSKQGQESFYFGQHTTKNVVASISFYYGGSGRAGEKETKQNILMFIEKMLTAITKIQRYKATSLRKRRRLMKIRYYNKDFRAATDNFSRGKRKILYIEDNEDFSFSDFNNRFDFYQIKISELISSSAKVRIHSIEREYSHFWNIQKWFEIPTLSKVFSVGLVKVKVNFENDISRILGVKKNTKIEDHLLDDLAEKLLCVGINNRFSILNPSTLDKTIFKLLVFRKYLSNEPMEIIELSPNILNV